MDMNKKGQAVFVFIMVAIMVFITAAVLTKPTLDTITDSRNASNLNCTHADASTTTKASCVIMDMGIFYFLSICIASSIAIITGKKNLVGVITSIMVFVVVVVLITPLKDFIVLARDSGHLNCAAAGLTVGNNLACIFFDLWLFYFIAVALAAGITFVFARKVLPKLTGEE